MALPKGLIYQKEFLFIFKTRNTSDPSKDDNDKKDDDEEEDEEKKKFKTAISGLFLNFLVVMFWFWYTR